VKKAVQKALLASVALFSLPILKYSKGKGGIAMSIEEKCKKLLKTDPAFKKRLRYFYILAKYGCIETAAAELKISAADLIRHIHALEQQLETPLFEDLSAGLVTPEGRA
jgi:hypothetical protein